MVGHRRLVDLAGISARAEPRSPQHRRRRAQDATFLVDVPAARRALVDGRGAAQRVVPVPSSCRGRRCRRGAPFASLVHLRLQCAVQNRRGMDDRLHGPRNGSRRRDVGRARGPAASRVPRTAERDDPVRHRPGEVRPHPRVPTILHRPRAHAGRRPVRGLPHRNPGLDADGDLPRGVHRCVARVPANVVMGEARCRRRRREPSPAPAVAGSGGARHPRLRLPLERRHRLGGGEAPRDVERPRVRASGGTALVDVLAPAALAHALRGRARRHRHGSGGRPPERSRGRTDRAAAGGALRPSALAQLLRLRYVEWHTRVPRASRCLSGGRLELVPCRPGTTDERAPGLRQRGTPGWRKPIGLRIAISKSWNSHEYRSWLRHEGAGCATRTMVSPA